MKNIITICLFVFSFLVIGNAQKKNNSIPQVEISGTRLLKINSSIVGQEYNLYIHLPRFYEDTTKTFPVVYLLDAQWDFPLITAIWGEQYYDGFIPGIIIVGITWGGENPNYDLLRARDFTPTKIEQMPNSGGASKFLSFIKEELIPFVDSEFRTVKNDCTLIGSSLGGLFTLYAMFNETKLFHRYVLTSPALGWDNEVIYSYEKKYSEKESQLPAKLFMAIGEYEDVKNFQRYTDHLKERNYNRFEIKTRILDGIGHSGTKAEGYTRGLQFAFEKIPFAVNMNSLDKYIGTYSISPQYKINIYKENESLIANTPFNERLKLYAENEKDFFVKGQYLFLHFNENESGKITGFQIEHFNGQEIFKKIE